jgi:hypothetical protein
MAAEPYRIDPNDPRAPPQEVWERLTPEERVRLVESLPSEFAVEERLRAELEQRLAEESRLRAEESRRREEAERRLAEALAELERLKPGRN